MSAVNFLGSPRIHQTVSLQPYNLCILVFIYGVQSQQAASLGSGIGQIVGFPGPCDGHQWPFFFNTAIDGRPDFFFFKKKGRPGGDGVALSICTPPSLLCLVTTQKMFAMKSY